MGMYVSLRKSTLALGELTLYWEELTVRYPQTNWYVLKAEDIFTKVEKLNFYFDLLEVPPLPKDKLVELKTKAEKNVTNTNWQYWYGLSFGEGKKYYDFPWVLQLAKKYCYSSERRIIKMKAKRGTVNDFV